MSPPFAKPSRMLALSRLAPCSRMCSRRYHPGYLLYVTGTVQRWKKTKRLLPGKVSQDGNDEGTLRLDRLPTAAEAELIRDLIGIRKRRHVTGDALSNLERARGSTKSPNFAPELAPEANGSLCASDGRAQKEAPATEFSGAQGSPLGV